MVLQRLVRGRHRDPAPGEASEYFAHDLDEDQAGKFRLLDQDLLLRAFGQQLLLLLLPAPDSLPPVVNNALCPVKALPFSETNAPCTSKAPPFFNTNALCSVKAPPFFNTNAPCSVKAGHFSPKGECPASMMAL